jgi:23S rRNA pseudouridine1911/1915/1917 synthase
MVAKDDRAQASLMAQLKDREVKKTYLGLVQGSVTATSGRVEAPIGRDPHHRTRMAVVPAGRAAVTGYRVRERLPGWTLLELDLITGRTHQIRVHLTAIGHPLAGDPVYGTGTSRRGPDGLERLFLHSWRIELKSPSDGHIIRATAPLPAELESVLERLRGQEADQIGGVGSIGGSSETTQSVAPVQKRPA